MVVSDRFVTPKTEHSAVVAFMAAYSSYIEIGNLRVDIDAIYMHVGIHSKLGMGSTWTKSPSSLTSICPCTPFCGFGMQSIDEVV